MSSYHLDKNQIIKLQQFIDTLNKLLREIEMSIEFNDGALFSTTFGYIGQLEDNTDHLVLTDGQEDILVSKRN